MQHNAFSKFLKLKSAGEKIAVLTAYDATFAHLLTEAGADALLVGDSLGMVLQGAPDTLAVRLSDVAYHVRCVRSGAPDAVIIGDMPFGTFQISPERAFANAVKLMAAGASIIKIEGGLTMAPTVRFLTERGIPVCAHVGLLPQWVRAQGGYKVQGRGDTATAVREDALSMEQAGAVTMVLEMIPAVLAAELSTHLQPPTIGIGSGRDCDGQVLVLHDMLGLSAGARKRFVKNFMADAESVQDALIAYVQAVKNGDFPAAENAF
ncbi:3-methyl-2-oxobutanoate hydroxymethyltransferase [Candidatus Persebacteraceae bacterium Df01]|jgi:3-methyl-2-oxobutanoate hydroxymethyltransferase|uniref:3-methyl-2-oxobutanoate hydroxymethyltransferase n=1 Tax=Candidatus Doriopsillibacter californiensis TaxID=2970740 RepID=A0ABT7QJV8_9GAMM|nr:3-methyl-2-oxobutanoate hydroxymethyltransferase [Candidatus Persebacteraceae bacterium Df01]